MESNIHVAVRIRPKSLREEFTGECLMFDSTNVHVIESENNKSFTFEKVLGTSASQEDVFLFVSPLIDSVHNGISSTIIAYGQTGSGKTYTMCGTEECPGVIPRILSQVFRMLSSDYTVFCSVIELYNEYIYDLLEDTKQQTHLTIRCDQIFGIYIPNLTEYVIKTPQEGIEVFNRGDINRSVRATQMSAQSSRSHLICQLTIECNRPNENGMLPRSKISLVDLAGSERISKTGYTSGLTLQEAKNINNSLVNLGRVIHSLATAKATHIPYRNSKLTRLLESSFEGSSQICLIATLSPSSLNASETISTLRFASLANQVSFQIKPNEISVSDNKLIQRLQKEIRYLKDCMKISNKPEDIHQKLWLLQEENERLKIGLGNGGLEGILEENKKMKIQLQKIMERENQPKSRDRDELDVFCDRFKTASAHRDSTPLGNQSKQIEVRVRINNNSVERRTTTLYKTLQEFEKERFVNEKAMTQNKRLRTLQQIEEFRQEKAKVAIEKYERSKDFEQKLIKKNEESKQKMYSEENVKVLQEIDKARKELEKAQAEKDRALQELMRAKLRKDKKSPLRSALTQELFLPKIN